MGGFWPGAFLSAAALSLSGPRTLVDIWDPVVSLLLADGVSREQQLDLGQEDEAAGPPAHSRRLSASFFSLESPGEEEELREVP